MIAEPITSDKSWADSIREENTFQRVEDATKGALRAQLSELGVPKELFHIHPSANLDGVKITLEAKNPSPGIENSNRYFLTVDIDRASPHLHRLQSSLEELQKRAYAREAKGAAGESRTRTPDQKLYSVYIASNTLEGLYSKLDSMLDDKYKLPPIPNLKEFDDKQRAL